MPIAKSTMADSIQAGVGKTALGVEQSGLGGVFTVTCQDKDGNLKWEFDFHNLVVNQGLQDLNTQYFKGSSWTPTWYLGLVDGSGSVTYSAGDTLASHGATGSGGWSELVGGGTVYSGNRKTVTFGTATTANPSVISNSASPSVFSITATATVAGAFLCSVASGTSGTLFSVGSFTGGNKSVANGDTINVTYTFSATAT
jgi:hypothetical protein